MVFSSAVFLLVFLPLLLLLYYLPHTKSIAWKNTILLLLSLVFYAWGEPLFVFLMLFSIVVNWLIGLQVERNAAKKKHWLSAAVIYDVLLIGVFKYASFISENIAVLIGNDRIILNIALPIGISFFTFQLMSYIFDVYYGNASAQKNPLYIALYISLFPQLIAGPIVRYTQIEKEIGNRSSSVSDITEGMRRFIYGLGKKMLLANYLGQIADNTIDFVYTPSVMTAWLGAVAYTLQIYFDFSGYSDMAIGLGRMFGFHFPENFNYPYTASSVTDFWRRWHISLSSWFRDYVYIPLGGNRVNKPRWILNLLIVWLLTGIWHGANWTFVCWGLIYFAVLLLEKQCGFVKKLGPFARVYTMMVVLLAWVFFRSADVVSACRYIGHLFGIGVSGFVDGRFITIIKATYVILVFSAIGTMPQFKNWFTKLEERGIRWVEPLWLLFVFCLSLLHVVSNTYNPFIYFDF